MSEHSFTEPTSQQTADLLLDRALAVLRDYEDDAAYLHGIAVTLSEAITNACVHGNEMDGRKSVTLTLTINESNIIADITDEGKGALKRIEKRPPSGLMSESGRGIDLIRHYSSQAVFTAVPGGGLRVSITFPRTGKAELTE